jgi:RNA polymerase sigma-70 factor, ECF subfamily
VLASPVMTPTALQKVSSTNWDWDELRSFCFRQALNVVGCPVAADEAAQEAIVRAWVHRDSCRQPERPLGWLRQIAHNEAVRLATRRPREVLVEEPLAAPQGSVATDEGLEDRLFMTGIVASLSASDQELARLRYYEDFTCAKLAEHFGLSEGNVKVRLHRLRLRLKQKLEEET